MLFQLGQLCDTSVEQFNIVECLMIECKVFQRGLVQYRISENKLLKPSTILLRPCTPFCELNNCGSSAKNKHHRADAVTQSVPYIHRLCTFWAERHVRFIFCIKREIITFIKKLVSRIKYGAILDPVMIAA